MKHTVKIGVILLICYWIMSFIMMNPNVTTWETGDRAGLLTCAITIYVVREIILGCMKTGEENTY